jgi:large subunit ribosomal protein L22
METIKASSTFIPVSPRKLRLIATAVKGLTPSEALGRLSLVTKVAAKPLSLVIKQAVANAAHNKQLDGKKLLITKVLVDEGSRRKRMDKSHGARFNRGIIQKQTAHITIELTERSGH